jgi:lactate dehydrogenase-like 2-hydroxyacid dehydrogenase
VIYHNRNPHSSAPDWAQYYDDPVKFLKETDVLSIHCPLNENTVNLVNDQWIRTLKPGSVIVNTARGKVLDEQALIEALEDGQ